MRERACGGGVTAQDVDELDSSGSEWVVAARKYSEAGQLRLIRDFEREPGKKSRLHVIACDGFGKHCNGVALLYELKRGEAGGAFDDIELGFHARVGKLMVQDLARRRGRRRQDPGVLCQCAPLQFACASGRVICASDEAKSLGT